MACKSGPTGKVEESSYPDLVVHPLLLDVVLDKVFGNLDLQQLLICRLVCRTWCGNSSLKTLIRNRSVVNLRAVRSMLLDMPLSLSLTARDDLSDYFHQGTIYSSYIFEDISYQCAFISKVFDVLGPTIKSLKLLLNLQQLNISQFRELIYERVPNLEELNIYNLSHKEVYSKPLSLEGSKSKLTHTKLTKLQLQETRIPIIDFMTDFLSTLPNLREISLKVGICRDWLEQADLWRENSSIATSVIKALTASGAYHSLKVFRGGKLRQSHIECLLEMGRGGLQLEVLQVHVPNKESEEVFTEFLNSQRNCLQQLILFEQRSARYKRKQTGLPGDNQGFMLKLPDIMPELEVLQLSKHYKSMIVPLHPVDFSLRCPKLKRLIFLGQCPDSHISLFTKREFRVREVVLWNTVHHSSTACELGSFSNLSKLHVRYPNCEFLLVLWKSCHKIQDLELIFEEGLGMDEGMTGISTNIVTQWVSQLTAVNFSDDVDNSEANTEFRTSSITNLRDLRTLKVIVEHNEESDRQALSDVTAHFALQKMVHLRYLELFTSDWRFGLMECMFLSKECQRLLEKELPLTVIHFAPLQT